METMFENYKLVGEFARNYVSELNDAMARNDWEEAGNIRTDFRRTVRELNTLYRAIDLMDRYGLKVS